MKINEIAFSCYPVTELKRARHFYETILGLKPSHIFGDETTAWIEYDIGPATLSIGNGAPDWKASPGGGCVGFEVEDFEAAMKRLQDNQVTVLKCFDTPVCKMAIISDPDGNSLIIHKRKACCSGGCECSH